MRRNTAFVRHPDYRTLFEEVDVETAAEAVHDGYFAIDKKGNPVEAQYKRNGELYAGSANDADRAYELIMKDKERLLSFETPLKFIFSHSALREGWDNPNVFQICSLRDIRTERERRQTIGRGLRICVNQEGQRVRGFDVNTLTVVAREGYKEFAENLQKEIEKDTGIRFGIVEPHQFASVVVKDEAGEAAPLGVEPSEALWTQLVDAGYLDEKGRVQDTLRTALKNGTVELPATTRRSGTRSKASSASWPAVSRSRMLTRSGREGAERVLESEEFKALWDRVKYKTTYRVSFDAEKLVDDCIEKLQRAPRIPPTKLQWRKADLADREGGRRCHREGGRGTVTLEERHRAPRRVSRSCRTARSSRARASPASSSRAAGSATSSRTHSSLSSSPAP